MFGKKILACCFLLTLFHHAFAECEFSEYLTRRSRWETKITKERRRTDALYKFSGSVMEVIDYSDPEEKRSESWSCHQKLESNTYVLKLDYLGPGGNERFMCLQFIERSHQVMQRKYSDVHDTGDERICNGLKLDAWPLVWPEKDDEYSSCPLDGGYGLDIRHYMNQESLCNDGHQILQPHLESECIKGEGLRIDFRHFKCRGKLGMQIVQNLLCLGSWEDGNYLFTVISNQNDLWPKLWMLRLPRVAPIRQPIKAVLSQDILVDSSLYYGSNNQVPLERIYELVLTGDNYPNLCDNEAQTCNGMCSAGNQLFCKKDCGVCQPEDPFAKCQFDPKTRGQWEEKGNVHGTQTVTITESMLYASDLIPFQCYQLFADGLFKGTGRKALVTLFKNGCKPRYTCAEFQLKSPDVMAYRLSQSSIWPATIQVNAGDVCSEPHFVNDPEPLGNKYRNKETKILVRKDVKRTAVPCDIDSSYTLLDFDSDDTLGVLWNSVVGYESSSDTILHETCASENSPSHKSRSMRCLASYSVGNYTQFIILEEKGNPDVVECWVLYKYHWDYTHRLMLLPPNHCNKDTSFRVDYGNNTHYIAKYKLSKLESESDPCSGNIKSPQLPKSSTSTLFEQHTVIPGSDQGVDNMVDVKNTQQSVPDSWSIKIGGLKSSAINLKSSITIILWIASIMAVMMLG